MLCLIGLLGISPCSAQPLYVSAILDGERLVLSDGSRVELVGVDAIEKFSINEIIQDVYRFGVDEESIRTKGAIVSAYITTLVKSRAVQVHYQPDVEARTNDESNESFRPAMVTVLNNEGFMEFILNKKVIQDGYAFADPNTPLAYKSQFYALQVQAMKEMKGFWALSRGGEKPRSKGNIESSEKADPIARCRLMRECVWVSGGNIEIGYWRSATGYHCPCDN